MDPTAAIPPLVAAHDAEYHPACYGDGCAEFYEQLYGLPQRQMLDTLAELAGSGPALELGLGTGRVALPLARRGVAVGGIEASTHMLDMLRSRPGAQQLEIIEGDFTTARTTRPCSLVFALVSTLFLLPDRHSQACCLINVSRQLAPGGRLLIEASVPDPANSGPTRHHAQIHTPLGERSYSVRLCPASTEEIDEMAARAGLRRIQRWRNWSRQPFHPGDPSHISVYGQIA